MYSIVFFVVIKLQLLCFIKLYNLYSYIKLDTFLLSFVNILCIISCSIFL
jgi:hypothetical protein